MSTFLVQTLSNNSETIVTNVRTTYKSLSFCNTHTSDVALDLYVKDSAATATYMLKGVSIPTGVSLKLENDEFMFAPHNFTLYAKSDNASGKIDIIKRY
jgi:hypothetical protein